MKNTRFDQTFTDIMSDSFGIRSAISLFLLDRQSRRFSPNTVRYYRVELNLFLRFLDACQVAHFDALTADVLRRYMLHQEERRNPGGCLVSYRAIKTFMRWAWEEYELEGRNPITRINPPKVPTNPLPGISLDDVQRLIHACTGINAPRDKAILMTLLDTGVRSFELCAFDIGDLNFADGSLLVRSGKGGKRRMVYLGQTSRRSIRRYLKTRSKLPEHAPLFLTRDGRRLTYYTLRQLLRRLSEKAGISEPGAHDFRRAFALNFLRNGGDIFTLQRLMGHADITVLRRYLAQTDDDLQSGHARFGPVDHLA